MIEIDAFGRLFRSKAHVFSFRLINHLKKIIKTIGNYVVQRVSCIMPLMGMFWSQTCIIDIKEGKKLRNDDRESGVILITENLNTLLCHFPDSEGILH